MQFVVVLFLLCIRFFAVCTVYMSEKLFARLAYGRTWYKHGRKEVLLTSKYYDVIQRVLLCFYDYTDISNI